MKTKYGRDLEKAAEKRTKEHARKLAVIAEQLKALKFDANSDHQVHLLTEFIDIEEQMNENQKTVDLMVRIEGYLNEN